MRNKKYSEPENGVLTERMNVKSSEFNDFQTILLNKSREQTKWQKINIELAAIRMQVEDYLKSNNI